MTYEEAAFRNDFSHQFHRLDPRTVVTHLDNSESLVIENILLLHRPSRRAGIVVFQSVKKVLDEDIQHDRSNFDSDISSQCIHRRLIVDETERV